MCATSPANALDPHLQALIAAAGPLGIHASDLSASWGQSVVAFDHNGHRELVFDGITFSSLSVVARQVCRNKLATHEVLHELGIPTTTGRLFHDAESERQDLERFVADGDAFVVKPLHGADGVGVGMDLRSIEEVVEHWRSIRDLDDGFLLEKQEPGEDLRIQSIGGRAVAACRREPASVIGDGSASIAELAAERDRLVRSQNPNNRLRLDGVSHRLLGEQGLEPDSVPEAGRRVRLKKVANIGYGGHVYDVTDRMHPAYADWVAAIARRLDMSIFSLDVISRDPSADPHEAGVVLEVNGEAQWLHHTFSEGRTHDIPTLILQDLFT